MKLKNICLFYVILLDSFWAAHLSEFYM